MFCEDPHAALLETGFTWLKRICCHGSCGPPLSRAPPLSVHWWEGWDGGRDSASLLWEEHSCFMNQALAEDGDRWSSQLALSDSFMLWVRWGACDWSLVCSTCCPGVELLSYQWGLGRRRGRPSIGPPLLPGMENLQDGSRGLKRE